MIGLIYFCMIVIILTMLTMVLRQSRMTMIFKDDGRDLDDEDFVGFDGFGLPSIW